MVKYAGAVKRLGPRYGRKIRHKLSELEAEQKKKHLCPYCHKTSVKRVAVGIWQCESCNAKFTNKAYTVTYATKLKEEVEEAVAEEEDENG